MKPCACIKNRSNNFLNIVCASCRAPAISAVMLSRVWRCDINVNLESGIWLEMLNGLGPSYLKNHISHYGGCSGIKIISTGLSLDFTTFTGVLGGNTEEGLLCCWSQTSKLPPTGSQAGSIFAVLSQAGKDFSLQTSFPSQTQQRNWPWNGL